MFVALVLLMQLIICTMPAHAQKLQGQALIDSIIHQLPRQKDDSIHVKLLNKLAFLHASINPDAGRQYGYKALALAQKIGDAPDEGDAYNQLGICYAYKSDYAASIENWMKALEVYDRIGSKLGKLRITGNIGNIYIMQGDYANALENSLQALKLAEDIGDKHSIMLNLGSIGSVYESLSAYKKALSYDLRSLALARELDENLQVATMLGNLGNLYFDIKEYDSALIYQEEALSIDEALGNNEGVGRNHLNLSSLMQLKHRYADALEHCFTALKLYEGIDYKVGINKATMAIGSLYIDMVKDTSLDRSAMAGTENALLFDRRSMLLRAVQYLQRSIASGIEIQDLDNLRRCYSMLSEAQQMLGDYKGALESHKQYTLFKDSVFSAAGKIKITNLETKRELQLKDKQIEIDRLAVLKKRNERGFFIAGIVLLLAIIAIVYRYYRAQQRLNKLLSLEKEKVEQQTIALRISNDELGITLADLKETQHQLIVTEKQKENEIIRSRISQDIHDDISSELTKITWISALAKAKAKKQDHAEVIPLLDKIAGYSQDTVAKLGEIIWTVNPKNDSLGSLLAYMRNYVAKFFADTAFRYEVSFPEHNVDMLINPELKRNLFLVMKESLNNAAKYSEANKIHVSCALELDNYTFVIADDGKGIADNVVHGGGNGLGNMRRRMEDVKGAFIVTSSPGGGTAIKLHGPVY